MCLRALADTETLFRLISQNFETCQAMPGPCWLSTKRDTIPIDSGENLFGRRR